VFKIGDSIKYGFYNNVKIVAKDDKHYILEDAKGQTKKVYIELVEHNAVLVDSDTTAFLMEYERLCDKHKIFINTHVEEPRLEVRSRFKGRKKDFDLAFKRSLIGIEKNTLSKNKT